MREFSRMSGEEREKVRAQLLEVKKKYPELWEFLGNEYGMCPPEFMELNEDEADTRCFGGCKLCWDDYENDPDNWAPRFLRRYDDKNI